MNRLCSGFRLLKLIVPMLCLALFISCQTDDEEDLKKGNASRFEQIVPELYSFPVIYTEVSENGKYIAATAHIQTTYYLYFSEDGGETWSQHSVQDGALNRYFTVTEVSNDGAVLIFMNDYYYTFKDGEVAKQNRQSQWDEYYLDYAGNLYTTMGGGLNIRENGETDFTPLELPEGFSGAYAGPLPGTGISFARDGWFYEYNPDTEAWTPVNHGHTGLPNKVTKRGQDDAYYYANERLVARVDASGNVTEMPFPDSLQYYANPLDLEVSADGRVIVLLGSYVKPQLIYLWGDGQWKEIYSPWKDLSFGVGIEVNKNKLYYRGRASGKLSEGLVIEDLTNGARNVVGPGAENERPPIYDAIIGRSGRTFVILDGVLREYMQDDGTLTDFQLSLVYSLYMDKEGKLFAFGNDVLYTSEDDGETWQRTSDFLSQHGSIPFMPGSWIVQQQEDKSYIAVGLNEYSYNLGGTGFSVPKFQNLIMKSTDGKTWSAPQLIGDENSFVTAIGTDGRIYLVHVLTSSWDYTSSHHLKVSVDGGLSFQDSDEKIPLAIAPNGRKVYTMDFGDENAEYPYWVREGDDWVKSDIYTSGATNYLPYQSLHFTSDLRLLMVTRGGVFLSDGKL